MKKNLHLHLIRAFFMLPLIFSVSQAWTQVPTVQDCLGAIAVCQDIYVENTTYTGTGNYPNEIFTPPGSCSNYCPSSCLDGEQNSVWYIFTVQQAGDLVLEIQPMVQSDDYDWAIYDLNTLRCEDIYGHPIEMQRSCNAAGGGGFQGNTGISSAFGGVVDCNNCGGTNKWNANLYVEQGKTFVLVMCNWAGAGAQGGYTLDFSNSTAIIYDDVRPWLDDVLEEEIHCGVDYITVDFSENVDCSSVNTGDFVVDGPGGPYDVIDVHGLACDLGGDFEKRYTLSLDRSINEDGDYSVELIPSNFVYDACNNFALENTIVFTVDLGAPEIDETNMTITAATCGLSNGSITGLAVIGTPPYIYLWTNLAGLTVGTELDLVDVPGDDYFLMITDENTCETIEGPYFIPQTGAPEVDDANMVITSATWGANNGSITGILVSGSEPFSYEWTDDNSTVVGNALDLTNVYTGYYTLLIVDVNDCDTTIGPYFVSETGGPVTVTAIANPDAICYGTSTQLDALGSGGTGEYTYSWVSNPSGFTSEIRDPVVLPLATTTYTVTMNDGFNITDGSVTVTVNDLPEASAGEDKYIPYGTSTTLYGECTGGSGDYVWEWQPAEKLINAYAQNPATKNLYETSMFRLVVSDLVTTCNSEEATVFVYLEGGPLGVTAVALEPEICTGNTTTLVALPGGGNFPHYTYAWTSDQGGSFPSDSMITVSPTVTTTYFVTVDDGFNITDPPGEVTVTVYQTPEFTMNNNQDQLYECPYDTIELYPDNPQYGWSYLWSNGAVTETIEVGTTGIGFDIKSYSLSITSEHGCESTQNITVVFDFAYCFGVDETENQAPLNVYPNPANEQLTVELPPSAGEIRLKLMDLHGRQVFHETLSGGLVQTENHSLDLSDNPPGIYLLEVKGDDYLYHVKVVLE